MAASTDAQPCAWMLFKNFWHCPQQGSVTFSRHKPADRQQEGRGFGWTATEGIFICSVVLFPQRFMRQLLYFIVCVARSEHKVIDSVQNRLKNITRKMMAAISELSMFQATAIKLNQE